jgi:hypothetical protein
MDINATGNQQKSRRVMNLGIVDIQRAADGFDFAVIKEHIRKVVVSGSDDTSVPDQYFPHGFTLW